MDVNENQLINQAHDALGQAKQVLKQCYVQSVDNEDEFHEALESINNALDELPMRPKPASVRDER